MYLIKDLIEIQNIKSVINLSDLLDKKLRRHISENFVFTGEVENHIKIIIDEIFRGRGQGFFLQGAYGTGKSHFLAILNLILEDKEISGHILGKSGIYRENTEIGKITECLAIPVSLIEHNSNQSLEDIIHYNLNKKLSHLTDVFASIPHNYSRQEIMENLIKTILEKNIRGIVLLIDELSEFLKSKPSGRQFNEDIRYLQFLGEFSLSNPLWIVASLQERLEETGEISPYIFNKIKDRYPARLIFTGKHIEELINKGLIIKKTGSTEKLKPLYSKLKKHFPSWPVWEEKFISLYPIHPMTIYLLDNLKFLFSQHRGVADFIHTRVNGDRKRLIKGIMDDPWDNIITPDFIFDHFNMRLKETVETRQYIDIVYKYYEQEMDMVFPDENDKSNAFKIIKLLILISIMPIKKNFSIREITEAFLPCITDMEPRINYDYMRNITEKLFRAGSYILKSRERSGETYSIDPQEDINLILKRKTEYILSNLFKEEKIFYKKLLSAIDGSVIPLPYLQFNQINNKTLSWQNTLREGYVILTDLSHIDEEKFQFLEEEIKKTEKDFIFIMGTPDLSEKNSKFIKNIQYSIILWVPEKIKNEEILKITFAHLKLSDELSSDKNELSIRLKEKLNLLLMEERKKITDIFLNSYKSGKFVFSGGIIYSIKDTSLTFEKISEKAISEFLDRKYPRHIEISPFTTILPRNKIKDLIEYFFRPGKIPVEQDRGLKIIIESFLKPMKLIIKSGGYYKIKTENNELANIFLSLVTEERVPLEHIYTSMRKGTFGISPLQFEILTYALIFSGLITPLSNYRKMSLNHITGNNFTKITHISTEEFQIPSTLLVRELPFIKEENGNISSHREIWEEICKEKIKIEEEIKELFHIIEQVSPYKCFKELDFFELKENLNIIKDFFSHINSGETYSKGFMSIGPALNKYPYFEEKYNRFTDIKNFFLTYLNDYLFIYYYITYPDFVIPPEEKYGNLPYEKDILRKIIKIPHINKSYGEELKNKWKTFLKHYKHIYTEEHNKYFNEQNGKCPYFESHIIGRKPFCHCGFKLEEIKKEILLPAHKENKVINSQTKSKPEAWSEESLFTVTNEKFPELLCLYNSLGEEDFNLILWGIRWSYIYNIDTAHICNIFSFLSSEDENEKIINMGNFLLEERKAMAERLLYKAEKKIEMKNMEQELWKILENKFRGGKLSGLINIIKKEAIFSFIKKKALYLLFKTIQNKPELAKENIFNDLQWGEKEVKPIKSFINIYNIIEKLKIRELKENHTQWEYIFTSCLAYMEYEYNITAGNFYNNTLLEEIPLIELKEELVKIFKYYEENFKSFYMKYYLLWKTIDKNRPYFHQDIHKIAEDYKRKFNISEINFLFIDCLRWDIWILLKNILFREGLKIVREIPLWANPPTVTSVQMEAFITGKWPENSHINLLSLEVMKKNTLNDEFKNKNILPEKRFTKYNFIDKKIHSSFQDLTGLYNEIISDISIFIRDYFLKLPENSMVIIFSDHGFKEVSNFTPEYKKYRYFHGQISPWEVITPLTIIINNMNSEI